MNITKNIVLSLSIALTISILSGCFCKKSCTLKKECVVEKETEHIIDQQTEESNDINKIAKF